MHDSHPDNQWSPEETPLPVIHAVEAAEAIREATYRMQRMQAARSHPEQLDLRSLAAMGAAFEDVTRGLAQLAGQVTAVLPDHTDPDRGSAQDLRDGLVAFRIAVLDASVAARALGVSTSARGRDAAVPRQRHR